MANTVEIKNLTGSDIFFRNFEGRETPKNKKGQCNFCVKLTPEQAQELKDSNHYVKMSSPDKDGNCYPFIKVNVNMLSKWPPEVTVYTVKGENKLNDETLKTLDKAKIVFANLECNSYMKTGGDHYTLWLRTMDVGVKDCDRVEMYRRMIREAEQNDDFSFAGDPGEEEDLPF